MNRFLCIAICLSTTFLNSMYSTDERPDVCVVFAHGYGGTGVGHSKQYVKSGLFPQDKMTVESFEFPDSPLVYGNGFRLNPGKTSFGQKLEVKILQEKFDYAKSKYKKVILAGVSRGAISILNSKVDGAIGIFVESPASSLKDVVNNKCKQAGFGWVPFLSRFIHRWIMPLIFKSYNPKGMHPVDKIKGIPNDIPIFISYTKKDNLIPASSSVKLAEELVKKGHKFVYLYGASSGGHGDIFSDKKYKSVVNAFLKECSALGQDYDCQDGQDLLQKCRIKSVDQVSEIRRNLERENRNNYLITNLFAFSFCATALAVFGIMAKKFV